MTRYGYNFRATGGYVTDGAGESNELGVAYSGGRGYGWVGAIGGTRDRSTSYGARLAGINFTNNTSVYWRLDLPEGPGLYRVWAGFFDVGAANYAHWDLQDGTTTFASTTGLIGTTNGKDATNAAITASAWNTANGGAYVDRTFTSDHLRIKCASTNTNVVAHISVEKLSSGTNVNLGTASESSSALSLSIVNPRSYALGTASESNTAPSISVANPRSYVLGFANETDSALALSIGVGQAIALGTASETSSAPALAVGNPRAYALGVAVESCIATELVIANPRSYALGIAAESDLAVGLSVSVPGSGSMISQYYFHLIG